MRLDCYKIHEFGPELVPGRASRDWMDRFTERHPYRCLPLTMANSTGWEIQCQVGLTAEWDGSKDLHAIKLTADEEWPPVKNVADSHFGGGILTFHTGFLFRTPPGWGVWVQGPPNQPKDGIYPLTGLVETDWLPFPFTMNWQFTRPGKVRFEKGEAFAFITLIQHNALEDVQPSLRMLDDNKVLKQEFDEWSKSRGDFINRLSKGETSALREKWQRHYMRGNKVAGEKAETHVTKRRLKPPKPPLDGL